MKIIGIDTRDRRYRVDIRAGSSAGADLVAFGLAQVVDALPSDAEERIQRALPDHNIE